MALIKCPNCNHDISDLSEKCIYCGFDFNVYFNTKMGQK